MILEKRLHCCSVLQVQISPGGERYDRLVWGQSTLLQRFMCFTAEGPNLHPSVIKQAWCAVCTHKRSHVCNQTCNRASSWVHTHAHTHEGWVGGILVLICGSAPLTYIALSTQQSNSVPQSGCSIVWLTLRSFLTATILLTEAQDLLKNIVLSCSVPDYFSSQTESLTRCLYDLIQNRTVFFMSVPAQSLQEFL